MNITNSAAEAMILSAADIPSYLLLPGGANVPLNLAAGEYVIDSNIELYIGSRASPGVKILNLNGAQNCQINGDLSVLGSAFNFGTGNLSAMVWFVYDGDQTSTSKRLFHTTSSTTGSMTLQISDSAAENAPKLRLVAVTNLNTSLIDFTTATYTPLTISPVLKSAAFSLNRNTLLASLYCNGALVEQSAVVSSAEVIDLSAYGAGSKFTIGSATSADFLKGGIVAIDFYKNALELSEVVHRTNIGPGSLPQDGIMPSARLFMNNAGNWANPDQPEFATAQGVPIFALPSAAGSLDVSAAITDLYSGSWISDQNGVRITANSKQGIYHNGGYLNFYSQPSASGAVRIHRL